MGFNMKGSPAKLGTIKGTAGHASALKMKAEADAASALKDLGHGGHPGMSKSEAAAATHGGKMSQDDIDRRKGADTEVQYTDDPKKKKSYSQAYKDRSDRYKNMSEEAYTKEAKRQNEVYKKTGKWDVKKSYPDTLTKTTTKKTDDEIKIDHAKGRVANVNIKKQKLEGKLVAKQPESDKGTKISAEERARIKAKKLAGKVKVDEEAGRKGLGSKIRKYRAGRKAKKVAKKYGTEKVSDPA